MSHYILRLYPDLSLRDRLTIQARLFFCEHSIMKVLDQYLPRQGLIVDLGCGYGVFSHLVSIACPDRIVLGIDVASHRIEVAKKSSIPEKNVKFYAKDIRKAQFPQCDAIIMIDVLYMLPYQEQEQMIIRCYERLNNGGVLVIKDNARSPRWKYVYMYIEEMIKTRLKIYGKETKKSILCHWDIKEFLMLLGKVGFNASMIPLKSYLPYPGVFYICHKSLH
jgi:2-polyprenyl-3-methyl-5-hydroxy-6-metoxy-1,4-benzoquinol methylase